MVQECGEARLARWQSALHSAGGAKPPSVKFHDALLDAHALKKPPGATFRHGPASPIPDQRTARMGGGGGTSRSADQRIGCDSRAPRMGGGGGSSWSAAAAFAQQRQATLEVTQG